MIELLGVSKQYGKFPALRDLDLEVRSGEIFGFLGPNGAGKTTTIKVIAGLIRPTSGEVWINGNSVQKDPLRAKQCVGLVPDRPFLYEKLTGREFLRFMASLYGVPRGKFETASEDLLSLFRLGNWADQLIESYSHGMRQRLVMAGAFIHDPAVLVVDEPMVGLDPEGARLLKDVFRGFAQQKRTIFLSTHSLPVAQELCDRIGILSAGRLVAVGTLEELREQSCTRGDLEAVFMALTRDAKPEYSGDRVNSDQILRSLLHEDSEDTDRKPVKVN